MDELLRDFLNETAEHIEGVENQLVLFERNPEDPSPISQIFRLVHTIKGTSSFLGLERLQRVTHAAETLIGTLRDGAPPTEAAVSLILNAMDRIKELLSSIEDLGAEPNGVDDDIVNAIDEYLASSSTFEDPGSRPALPKVINMAAEEPVEAVPAAQAPKAQPATPKAEPVAAKQAAAQDSNARGAESIRVAVGTIERIMELVSELVLARNQLMELTRHGENDTVKTPLQRLSALTSDLQDAVMRARMQPMTRLFSSMPRLVRELATDLGKKIDLVTSGADTELDRQLIDVIRDPLTHLIRNCADHGIEMPDDRMAAGKPEFGTISVSAQHEAGQITLEISDDGRGIDPKRIRDKALQRGLVTEAKLADMTDDEVYRFILEPGFSTAEAITKVSGRGVGMDVVRSNIESIGGTISIASSLGRGGRFTLKIPLTLAIAPALIVAVQDQRFALPQHAVVEAVGVGGTSRHSLEMLQNALVLKLREEVVPVVDLRTVLGLEPIAYDLERLVVIMRVGIDTFGVIVDGVADVQEIVVKPLGSLFANLHVFTGHTILGDGTVVLILDPSGIAASIGVEKSAEQRSAMKAAQIIHADSTNLVLFRAGHGALKVLPLSLVSRIATVETRRITEADGRLVFRYQDKLTPVIPVAGNADFTKSSCPILLLTLEGETFGLWVDQILDIIEDKLNIQLSSTSQDVIGTAELQGQPVELLDPGHFLKLAYPESDQRKIGAQKTILLVDNEISARDMLVPSLSAAGYRVIAVASLEDASSYLRPDHTFDAVLVSSGLRAQLEEQSLAADLRVMPPVIPFGEGEKENAASGFHAGDSKFNRYAILDTLARTIEHRKYLANRSYSEIAA